MTIFCRHKYESKSALTGRICCMAALACTGVPVLINVPLFVSFTGGEMNELKNVIQGPIIANDTYSCSLAFYKMIFAVMIFNYAGVPVFLVIMLAIRACLLVLRLPSVQHCLQCFFQSTIAQDQPRTTVLTPNINSTCL